ncbi:MAG TPA: BTAD domain-containing putative transcriptional regulator [Solirubrobacteraceae bacterium]|nr:BTAD domain-containing putative transcriptional regulator [Solirubrobacteraceae bacterium]
MSDPDGVGSFGYSEPRRLAPVGHGRPGDDSALHSELFESVPFGILLAGPTGAVQQANGVAERLLGYSFGETASEPSCCDLLCQYADGPRPRCLTLPARKHGVPVPEIRIDIDAADTASVWVSISPAPSGAVICVREGIPGDRRRHASARWVAGPVLRIRSLGTLTVTGGDASLNGEWLEHRPGRLLKFLIAHRHAPVHAEQIAAALWPSAGTAGLANLRQCAHALRERLEPRREPHQPSSFIVGRGGSYALDSARVKIDVDEFELLAREGLGAAARRDIGPAIDKLNAALEIYAGDFLADEPYAEWAFSERDRLRDVAGQALRSLSTVHLASGKVDNATRCLQRLTEVDPLDENVERQLIGLHLQAGRHGQALRRYEWLRQRMRQEFGTELSFELRDLKPASSPSSGAMR